MIFRHIQNTKNCQNLVTDLQQPHIIYAHTGPGNNTCRWFGEVGSCCCLPLLPQLACNILATTYKYYFRAQYNFAMLLIEQISYFTSWAARRGEDTPRVKKFDPIHQSVKESNTVSVQSVAIVKVSCIYGPNPLKQLFVLY